MCLKKFMISLIGSAVILSAGATNAFADDQSKLRTEVSQVVGTPYKWGTSVSSGFDCSGFILYIFDKFNLERTDIKCSGKTVPQSQRKSQTWGFGIL